jgi:hypothetical protein
MISKGRSTDESAGEIQILAWRHQYFRYARQGLENTKERASMQVVAFRNSELGSHSVLRGFVRDLANQGLHLSEGLIILAFLLSGERPE